MSYLNLTALILAAYFGIFAEASLGWTKHWLGAQIDIAPVLMVYCGLSSGLATVTGMAVLTGLWFDSLSANPLGISILPQFLVGFSVFQTREVILREQPYARFILGAAGSAAAPFLTLVLLWGGGYKPLVGWGSLWQWLVLALTGGMLTPACFWFFEHLNRALAYRSAAESTFRSDREIKRGRN